MRNLLFPLVGVCTLAGCNSYDLFRVAGYQQSSFANEADILFIVDNSPSMYDNTASLGLEFNTFIDRLTDPTQGSAQVTESLSDAVGNYINYVSEVGRFLDYQLGITSMSVTPSDTEASPGESGWLAGANPIVSVDTTSDIATSFRTNLFCSSTDWPAPCGGVETDDCIPYDPTFECGDEPDMITWEYLSCICGEDWEPPTAGSGSEEGLEALFLAMCRADPDPPEECFDPISPFKEADVGSNSGFLRDGATLIAVFITDEGDVSRRLPQGEEDIQPYLDLFDLFDRRMAAAVIGPNYNPDDHSFLCNSGSATSWGTVRYQDLAEETRGFYATIEAEDNTGECIQTAFSQHLNELGDLLNTLLNIFPLQTVPDPSTIRVFVDRREVSTTICETVDGEPTCGDGWVYQTDINAVEFFGDEVPSYNSDVRIYYEPLSEMPRSLPF